MTTLTQTAFFSKKAFLFAAIGLVIILILFFAARAILGLTFPSPPAPATVAFGKLPRPDFSDGIAAPRNISYKIETISGELPKLATSARVLAIVTPEPSFGAQERAKISASKVGFQNPKEVSGGILRFSDPQETDRILMVDTISGDLTLESNFLNKAQISSSKIKSVDEATEKAIDFLNQFDVGSDEFPRDLVKTKKLKVQDGKLVEALTGDLNLVEVNFQRAAIDKLPVVNPRENKASISILVSANKIVEATVKMHHVERFKFATYPLKSTNEAFEDLTKGKGILNREANEEFIVRDVKLGYLETQKEQPFLQPVYIFESDNFWQAYVAAVDETWFK